MDNEEYTALITTKPQQPHSINDSTTTTHTLSVIVMEPFSSYVAQGENFLQGHNMGEGL
jgi:hypothetical protein